MTDWDKLQKFYTQFSRATCVLSDGTVTPSSEVLKIDAGDFIAMQSLLPKDEAQFSETMEELIDNKYYQRNKWFGHITFEPPVNVDGHIMHSPYIVLLIDDYVYDFYNGINAMTYKVFMQKLRRDNESLRVLNYDTKHAHSKLNSLHE